jgi:uncharacterized protein
VTGVDNTIEVIILTGLVYKGVGMTKALPELKLDALLECTVGSTLHGVVVSDGLEDLDMMGIVVESARHLVGFYVEDTWTWRSKPEGVRSEAGDVDYTAYGLRKYLNLVSRGNPTMMLPLFAPDQFLVHIDSRGRQLRELSPYIVSRQCYPSYRGYMRQQHERLLGFRGQRNVTRPELVEAYGYDTKYAANIVRLGLQGAELLETGKLTLPMPEKDRRLVIDIRSGVYTLPQVSDLIVSVENSLVGSFSKTELREKPDMDRLQQFMLDIYVNKWRAGRITTADEMGFRGD